MERERVPFVAEGEDRPSEPKAGLEAEASREVATAEEELPKVLRGVPKMVLAEVSRVGKTVPKVFLFVLIGVDDPSPADLTK